MTTNDHRLARRRLQSPRWVLGLAWAVWWGFGSCLLQGAETVDFNRDIRRILSDNCNKCHGPDAKERKGGGKLGLRLDTQEGSRLDLGGYAAIVPGHPEESELIRRVTTEDPDDLMPPSKSGKKLTPREVALLREWIVQGADYARHWAYVKPTRAALPEVKEASWPHNAIDYFILDGLERENLRPAPEADRYAILRRAALDLTGLPPTPEEADQFVRDTGASAYERMIDRLLDKEAFGEHWARLWLDQARYADSTGYADDPPRTIWGYRDYVIRSLNQNKPFDQFTVEQLAGDLLPEPTEEQLIATAFHRNTLTNNEGGTDDEEYRNVAIVDRVNTTMAVWMGTTMACAQCHDHKYDPISQEDYFRLFAILNNTEDADRRDESPFFSLYTPEQKQQKQQWKTEIARLETIVKTITPSLAEAQTEWEKDFHTDPQWQVIRPLQMTSQADATFSLDEDGAIRAERKGATDVYTFSGPVTEDESIHALRVETLPDEALPGQGPGHAQGNFVISRVLATLTPPNASHVAGRYLRIEIPGREKILSLAEVQVFDGTNNIAGVGEASQSSTDFEGPAKLAIDGNTDGNFSKAKSTTHTASSENPWWELDLKSARTIDRVVLWNRTDGDLESRLSDFRVALLGENRETVWEETVKKAPDPSTELSVSGARALRFVAAFADFAQKDFPASSIIDNPDVKTKGWAVGSQLGRAHTLTLIPESPVEVKAGSQWSVTVEQLSKHEYHTLGKLRLAVTSDARASTYAQIPEKILALVKIPFAERTAAQQAELTQFYLSIAPALQAERAELKSLQKQLAEMKPYTTVPMLRELTGDKRRVTHIQRRGSFLDLGAEVAAGLPKAFAPATGDSSVTRLTLARWLVNESNPLTARVIVNRFWESIFGIGIVRTSEEFGAQGELPSHPELLDWLAVEFMESGWNIKHLLKLMVTSSAYRQSSKVTPELETLDPDNRLLARGPRFRLSAETIRDQAMFVSDLLSHKLYGPPVKPPQPKMGLSAAFGSGIDWETSQGEDKYRRAIYTMWRRSNPYPSMAAFDAPNREVCMVRRERTNTPLQALVTLNDPVYLETAQALGRRMAAAGASPAEKARHGFRLCLTRPPGDEELQGLLKLYGNAYARFVAEPEKARAVATQPIGDAPTGSDVAELAAWTVVGNVLLNLDETLMKR